MDLLGLSEVWPPDLRTPHSSLVEDRVRLSMTRLMSGFSQQVIKTAPLITSRVPIRPGECPHTS